VVFAGEPSTIHLNDGNENSFARETSTGLRLDPQASNAGVPTAIFPAGTNPVGSPDNLQLEGPAYSDPELLGMAYAFELYANGHRETKYAPALSYVPDSVTPPQVVVAPAPPTTTEAPKPSEPTNTEKVVPVARLVGGLKFHKGKLEATIACTGTTGKCHVILQLGGTAKKPAMQIAVTVAAGKQETVTVRATKALRKQIAHAKGGIPVRLVSPAGAATKVKVATK
jgi:hypothetical protein